MKTGFLGLLFFMSFGSLAEASSFRVLGRGLYDAETGSTLQIACVGEVQGGEQGCESLQFLLTDHFKAEQLVGPVMKFVEGEKLTRKKVLQEMRQQNLAPPKKLRNSFRATKVFHLGEAGDGVSAAWLLIGGHVGYALSTVAFAGGLSVVTVPVIGGALLFVAIPVLTDLARLPFQMRKARRDFGCLFGDMGPNITVAALNDRSKPAWQLKPKRVSSKGFQRFVQSLIEAESRN